MERQHSYDTFIVAGGDWETWECSKCGHTTWPNVFGGFWRNLARYFPFCGRWRCR